VHFGEDGASVLLLRRSRSFSVIGFHVAGKGRPNPAKEQRNIVMSVVIPFLLRELVRKSYDHPSRGQSHKTDFVHTFYIDRPLRQSKLNKASLF